ncbi:ATP-binding protein [Oceaniglobus trochenteri]|uniref:ATP-binding protein n=1 Tax=Oceaniglobus trochenteri TaxID=2763260 RepID=UPI001CFFF80D|nr:ATP-binding protein [Oceaniglobus trochenteri]
MKLVAFEITGFRGYRELRRVKFEDLTTFVGRNDAGKSSLMDALELFFSSEKLHKDDLCVLDGFEKATLTAEFRDFPDLITLDATSETTLEDERLLLEIEGAEPVLRMVKVYTPGKTAEIFIDTKSPEAEGIDHPILLKQAQLRQLGRDLGLEDSIPAAERIKNPPWRRAIFDHFAAAPMQPALVPISTDDAKKIWDQLKSHIPYFCLFKVDRPSSDQDSEARDPLAAAAKIAIAEREEEIGRIVQEVEARATALVTRTLEKLQEMAPDLAVGLTPDVSGHPKWDGFRTTLKTDSNVPFNKRGSGTKRLVLLNFFRAEAERRAAEDGRSIIYAFEEPESSQHPANQRLLLESFKRLAMAGNSQVVLTTHSPLVAQNLPAASLKLVTKDGAGACPDIQEVNEGGADAGPLLDRIAAELGVLPDSRVVVLVMVEGPNDVNFFENIYPAVSNLDADVIDLMASPNVAVVPMGGADLKHWVSKKYLQALGCVEYHIFDRDCGPDDHPKYQDHVDEVNGGDNENTARLTRKRETENYIHRTAIQTALQVDVAVSDFDDIPRLVSDASKQTPGILDMGQGSAKRRLNLEAARAMDSTMLQEIDPEGEVVGWFRDISEIVRHRLQ